MHTFRHSHEPTDAQLRSGNYAKAKRSFQGMTVAIETPAGMVRRGVDSGGVQWESRMSHDYGYVVGSMGMDGDAVDVFLGLNEEAEFAYVIDQCVPPSFSHVDEQKVMLGFDSEADACAAYLANYSDARFLGSVTVLPVAEFCEKVFASYGVLIKALGSLDALEKALEAGERWITVHPNGDNGKGVPLLIKEHPDGTASVIGGAGGKMNHMKLRGVKPKSDYKAALSEKHAQRQEARRLQIAKDKESGVHDEKQAKKKEIAGQVKSKVEQLIKDAQELLGWSPEETEFDESAHADLSPEALNKAKADHRTQLLKRVNLSVKSNRDWLVSDAEARMQAGLGEIPISSDSPDALAVSDLDPMPEVSGAKLGFDPKYGERSDVSNEEANTEGAALVGASAQENGASEAAKSKAADTRAAISQELEAFKLINPDSALPNPKILDDAVKAAALLRIDKQIKMLKKQGREAIKELRDAPDVESKAAIIDVSDADVDDATRQQVEDEVRTAGARTFLKTVDGFGGDSALAGHINTGAFNAINAVAVNLGGDALIDRSVVDVLGVDGAVQVLARRLRSSMGDDAEKVAQAVEDFHLENSDHLQATAVAQAQELHDAAAAIELGDAEAGADLVQAQAANHKRREAIAEAQKVLGQAAGEMQAGASLTAAMRGGRDTLEVSLGKTSPEQAVLQLRAIGLKPGDYHLDAVGDNLVSTITGEGMDRLSKPFDAAGMAQIKRNMDIMSGSMDEDGWLPGGVANRPDLCMHVEPGVAERLGKPFKPEPGADDLHQSLQNYIGGRMADGDAMVDILADVQSSDFFQRAGDHEGYRAALNAFAPLKGEDGKMRPVESLRGAWEQMADSYVSSQYGADRAPIHSQSFDVDQTSVDALHRSLAQTPEGVAAFKPVGELSAKERNGLRNWWHANIAKEDDGAAAARMELEAHEAEEPEKDTEDMFGETTTNPEWSSWKGHRDKLAGGVNASSLSWTGYVKSLGSPAAAIETVQDLVRSHVAHKFALAHNTLRPDSPLKLGTATVRNNLRHLDAVDPASRAQREEKEKALMDSLRERLGGKYASGGVKDKLDAAKQEQAAFNQSQMGFFSSEELPADSNHVMIGADERFTIGHAAERKLAGMMSVAGKNFKPGQPTKLFSPTMSGGKNFARQRLIKLLEANKRVVAAFSTGSGKSLLQLAGFSHLHAAGKVKKGVILCPSIVQGQMGGEALRFLEPGKYKWHADPGASREERLAAYRDPGTHFVVATHQSFRDDMLHLGATHAGIPEDEMAARVQKMAPADRKAWAQSVMKTEGFNMDYMTTDESQFTLNREGKENSNLANVVDGFADNAEYYMPSSGDPAKNDASEVFDLLSKMDRARYSDRDAFMRKYGVDTVGAKQALKREMARYVYSSKIDPDVKAERKKVALPLNDSQKASLSQIDKDVSAVKIARLHGTVAIDALKRLSPQLFANAPEETHSVVADELQKNVGLYKNAAVKRVINANPDGASIDYASKHAHERRGKPGVIFAHNLEMVEHLRARLEEEGHRVVTITGGDSSADKDKKRKVFNPESGDAGADIMIASDAGATGMNLQRGQWLLQMDTPDTAMTHGQRNGRIFRTGQKNDVELTDVEPIHPSVQKSVSRLQKKYGLRELLTSPMEGLDDTGVAWHLKQKLSEASGATV